MNSETFQELTFDTIPADFIWLHEQNMDIGGGEISIQDIDRLKDEKDWSKVAISGLNQHTFEYFITHYGHAVRYLIFFKNKKIEDLSLLSTLSHLKYVKIFLNHKTEKLWDMCGNKELIGISLSDFTRLHSLEGIQTAPNLQFLRFGDAVWPKSTLVDIEPLRHTNIEHFCFDGKKIDHTDLSIYTEMLLLNRLDFPHNLYSTEEIAQIIAACPRLQGNSLRPYIKVKTVLSDGKDVLICGKRKPRLSSEKDKAKIKKYEQEFERLLAVYKGKQL
ncbi:hypothetical protein [Listeria costaricensis]|uniref:hypothetical protein n=1 Tax=Listeria costaricensis TaxID=2026604 RepID=UPI000C06AEEB|nr:hypothetical protein [Listeria costaricensis]